MIVELRQYTLRPGRRDELIELFDREFVETQEALGIVVLGQFRDLDDPDKFVWLRSFPDMVARKEALTAFYGGPVWAAHRDQANATMIDSDDVLLLRPVGDFPVPPRDGRAPRLILITEWPAAGEEIARLRTEHAENTFPDLPIRRDIQVDIRIVAAEGDAEPGPLRLAPTARSRLR